MQENQIIKATKDKKSKNSILSPKLDVVFQILFGEVGSEEITKDLEFHTQWKIIEEKCRKVVLTDDLELHIIELPKMRKNKATGKDKKLLEWLSFLNNPESEEVASYMKNNESMKKAKEKLNTMSEDERIIRLAELREKAILDELEVKAYNYKKGKNDGLAQGLEQKNREIAKKMKEKNYKIEDIIDLTNLSKEEIENL